MRKRQRLGSLGTSLDNLILVRKTLLTGLITTLGSERMDEICRALTYTTGR
jgi:hypothetical protein